MLNREKTPEFLLPTDINIIQGVDVKLNNGIPVHIVDGGTQEVVKIDLIFPAGSVQAAKPLVASFTNYLMQEGTVSYSAMDVAETIDFYGAFLGQSANYHHAQITLYALSKYLPNVFPVLEEIIKKPLFDQHEFDVYLAKKKQDYLVDSEKVKTLAFREAQEVLFGEDHPYGRVAKKHHYDEISLDDLKTFHGSQYASNLCQIIVAGKPGDGFVDLLNKHFGGDDWSNKVVVNDVIPEFTAKSTGTFIVEKENAMQSALKVIRHGITKTHPDYLPMLILNTVFGGYFGSRLMNNLREDKGLTYGISSYMVSYLKAGVFGISTEVLAEKRVEAVKEIFNEMAALREELVDEEELNTVKNFMLGDLMRNLDGAFAISDAYRALLGFDLDSSYFENLKETIVSITAKDLNELANKYLVEKDFYVVVAGK